ncbi:MAG: Rho termination factor N-terminal domain-containing protein [Desulfomonile tiedjei]|uniref:Rho termination factor N-terminal domain-containing protein n=1 Tax=Desulfomonile tiedjei TaxID=2358 RepID=A0A9D6V1D6_9BACT|nr:Rho termination factor N-terminal domain-containing protein [Desulfomonile tiedjei]
MTLRKIREKARAIGVRNYTRYKKETLIRVIQEVEGNSPCFKGLCGCGEYGCLWREECQS